MFRSFYEGLTRLAKRRLSVVHKVSLLGSMNTRPPATTVYVQQHDLAKGLLQFSYHSRDGQNTASIRVNDQIVSVSFPSRRIARVFDHIDFIEHFFWAPLKDNEHVSVLVDGKTCTLRLGSTKLGTSPTLAEIRGARKPPKSLPEKILNLRRAATSSEARDKYADCWLLIDRDDKADDNAEHLYRYLVSIHKADNAFFVLRPDSPDWPRLEAEGFRLIPFDSLEHHVALINAAFLTSSHANGFILWPVPLRQIRDLTKCRFVFLQHGVIHTDLSRWLNSKNIARLITTTNAEFSAIAGENSAYKFSQKEVALTGLPRHDRLLAFDRTTKTILIMPTWRKYLAGQQGAGTEGDLLTMSAFALRWGSLLRSPRLRGISQGYKLNLVFCPHPNLSNCVGLGIPDHVQVRSPMRAESLQPLFAETAVLITDYSSVAFDVAYLEKPVLYYHFDADEIFGGEHVCERGYFDYASQGFGPVSETEDQLLTQLEATLVGGEDPIYAARRRDTFTFRDGKCCERVYQSILDLDMHHESARSMENAPLRDGFRIVNPKQFRRTNPSRPPPKIGPRLK